MVQIVPPRPACQSRVCVFPHAAPPLSVRRSGFADGESSIRHSRRQAASWVAEALAGICSLTSGWRIGLALGNRPLQRLAQQIPRLLKWVTFLTACEFSTCLVLVRGDEKW